jgi:hypothetical protein
MRHHESSLIFPAIIIINPFSFRHTRQVFLPPRIKKHTEGFSPPMRRPLWNLSSQPQILNYFPVTIKIVLHQVIEQGASLPDQLQKAAARVMIFFVNFEMLRELKNPRRQYGNLYFRRTCVPFVLLKFYDDFLFLFRVQHLHPSA